MAILNQLAARIRLQWQHTAWGRSKSNSKHAHTSDRRLAEVCSGAAFQE
jgi:hypothetical protein